MWKDGLIHESSRNFKCDGIPVISFQSSNWNLLSAVKTEFGKYAAVLDRVKEKLRQASDRIDDVAVRSRAIGRKLRKVEKLPVGEADKALMLEGEIEGDGEAE